MKTKQKIFLLIVSSCIFSAWATKKQSNEIKKAQWLIGTWENKTSKGSLYETWNKENDYKLSGKSYMIKSNDTIVFENIQLLQNKDGLFYIPTVKNQNGGMPIKFINKRITDKELVFENLTHDFPQLISYYKITSDSLIAEISGTKNGHASKQTFAMKRIK